MNDDINPYELLGVDVDATQAEIKAAYKAKAQRLHPDKPDNHGCAETEREFRMVKAAYEILSDTARRAKYDSGGGCEKPKDDQSIARERMLGLFNQACEFDEYTDIVKKLKSSVTETIPVMHADIEKLKRKIKRLSENMARVKKTDAGINFFENIVVKNIEAAENTIKNIEHEVVLSGLVLDMLNDYECQTKERKCEQTIFTISSTEGLSSFRNPFT